MPNLSNLASSLSTSWTSLRGYRILQAHDGIRTRDLFLTKEVLYRLSYMGPDFIPRPRAAPPYRAQHDNDLWSGKRDSNPRPRAWKARALPTELFPPTQEPNTPCESLVERGGFEPPKA
jgi:hypothetical protein